MSNLEHDNFLDDNTRKPDYPSGYWFTSSVNADLKRLSNLGVDNYQTSRLLYVYENMNAIMLLVHDAEKCDSYQAKEILKETIKEKLRDLRNLRIADDRYNWLFDDGI